MIQKNSEINITTPNIYLEDLLERKDAVENISNMIASTNEAFVMSLNANWGAGKTTFIKLLKANLNLNHDVKSIYFSAWEDDFSKEPLISILGELNKFIEEKYKTPNEITTKFNKTKKLGVKILKRGLPALIKGSTAGLLDIDKGYESAVSAMTEEATSELIDNYSKDKLITESFKESMKELFSKINSDKPFVFFIDELDRCRPLYAIELLERIKHIFGIDNLIFILSIDKIQLSESIKSQYGNIDTNNYLKRFIDLEYNLQNPNIDKFCDALYNEFNLDNTLQTKSIKIKNDEYHYLNIFKYLNKAFSLSLRQVEQVFIHLDIVFKTVNQDLSVSHLRVFVFFVVLKSYDSKIYFDFIHTRDGKNNINNIINKILNDSANYRNIGVIIEAILLSINKNDEEYLKLIKEEKEKELLITDKKSIEYHNKKRLINVLEFDNNQWDEYKLNKLINYVIEKIEFSGQFNLNNNITNTSLSYKEQYFNSFDESSFKIMVDCLQNQGYVIDIKEENNIMFSSVQVEHMTQNMFDKLSNKFMINININVFPIGDFYENSGACYMVYNTDIYEYEDAKKVLDLYVSQI